MRFQRLTRIRLQLAIYFCLHRGKFARKHCTAALHELADFGQLGISCREAKNEEELEQCTARLRAEETRLLAFAKPVKAKAARHCACAD